MYEDVFNDEEHDYTNLIHSNPFRYRGYYYDTETEYYYLQSRYYDPDLSRFINADDHNYLDTDTVNGLNLFAYCTNNPVDNVDYNGCAYSPSKAKAYADKWWCLRNTKEYKTLSSDCTNFVSQCLWAGGLSKMTGVMGSSKGWHHYKLFNKFQISDAWGKTYHLHEWLHVNDHVSKEYIIKTNSDVDKVGKVLYGKYCYAAVFFAESSKSKRINIDGKIQRAVYLGHSAISGQVVHSKSKYDVYYYAHSKPRNGKRYYNGKREYHSFKDYLKSYKGSAIYVCMLQ